MSWFRRHSEHPTDEDLSAYLDGGAGRRSAAIERHVDACDACATRLAALREVKSMLGALPRPAASRSFVLGPEHEMARTRAAERRPVFAFAPAVALSLLVALLLVDFAVISDTSTSFESRATSQEAGAAALSKDADDRALQPAAAPPTNAAAAVGAPVAPTSAPAPAQAPAQNVVPPPTTAPQATDAAAASAQREAAPIPTPTQAQAPAAADAPVQPQPPAVPPAATESLAQTVPPPAGAAARAVEPPVAPTALVERVVEPTPAVAPRPNDAAAGAAAQADRPPTAPTALVESFAEPPPAQPEADADGAATEAKSDNGARNAIRVLEVVAAIGFVVTLALFLRQRRA